MTINNVPDFRLTMGGSDLRGSIFEQVAQFLDITAKVRPRLLSLTLSEKRGEEADQLDITLDDADGQLAVPSAGAKLQLQLGWIQGSGVVPGLVDKGVFIVDEVSHGGPPDIVTIKARAAEFSGSITTRREQGYNDTTLGAIVNEVAGRHQLKPLCAASLAAIPVKHKSQSRESDLAFVRRLGREHDAVASIKQGSLIVAPKGSGATPSGKTLPVITLKRSDGGSHSFRIEKREAAEGVTAAWHDRAEGKRKTHTEGKADGAKKLGKVFASEGAARTAAKSEQSRSARAPYSLDLNLALGRPDIYPEQKARVSGYKKEIDETEWLVSEVSHSITAQGGFTTSLKLEGAGAA